MFVPLMKRFRIYFFWEQEKTHLGSGYDYVRGHLKNADDAVCVLIADCSQVVTEASAAPVVDGTERCGMPYDHRSMCRFDGRSAARYKVVVVALIRYSNEAQSEIPRRWNNEDAILRSMRESEAAELLI